MPELGVCTNMTIDSTGGSLHKPSISASFPSPLQSAYNDVKIRNYALLLFPAYIWITHVGMPCNFFLRRMEHFMVRQFWQNFSWGRRGWEYARNNGWFSGKYSFRSLHDHRFPSTLNSRPVAYCSDNWIMTIHYVSPRHKLYSSMLLSSCHTWYRPWLLHRSGSEPLDTAPVVSPRMCINLKPYQFSCTCGTEVFQVACQAAQVLSAK